MDERADNPANAGRTAPAARAGSGDRSEPTARGRGGQVRGWLRVMVYVLIIVVLWLALVWFGQRMVMFPRHAIPVPAEATLPSGGEQWMLETPAGEVEAWFLPGEGVSAAEPGPAVIFAHGNGELIDFWPQEMARYRRLGVSVLLPEYRGYGRSAGRPSQKALVSDFVAFHDRLARHEQVDVGRIVYHGRSIGNGVVAGVARQREPAAMICQSSFTSAAALARRFLVPRVLMRDPFEVRSVLAEYAGPVLILHGREDEIIPAAHAEQLHEATPRSELILYDGIGHNEPMPAERYWQDIERFLDGVGVLEAGVNESPGG